MKQKLIASLAFVLVAGGGFLALAPNRPHITQKVSAACVPGSVPSTYGQVTQTVNVGTAGSYRLWSRIKAASTTANSYYFRVDSGCNYNVGDATSLPAGTWTWVNYQDASSSSVIDLDLSAGTHTLTYSGKEADFQLSQILLLNDTSCVPTGNGENCAVADKTAPTVTLTSPSNGSTVSGTVDLSATASDSSGISKVEFLVDGTMVGSDSASSYSYVWNSSSVSKGSHTIQAKAYDMAGNTASSTAVNVTVSNTGTTPPTPPAGGGQTKPVISISSPTNGSAATPNSVVMINVTATDDVGVTRVDFLIDGDLKNTLMSPPYAYPWNTTGLSAISHSLTAKAYDADGNITTSSTVTVNLGTGTAPQPVTGDINGDGRVNAIDLSALISHDGQNYAAADFNKDGTVGAADMAILLSKWTW